MCYFRRIEKLCGGVSVIWKNTAAIHADFMKPMRIFGVCHAHNERERLLPTGGIVDDAPLPVLDFRPADRRIFILPC
jgi:hypothetical protein